MNANRKLEKSLYSKAYGHFLELLREARLKAGLTQAEAAKRFKKPQSFLSKCESGERRVDVVELIEFCRVYNVDLVDILRELERGLTTKRTAKLR